MFFDESRFGTHSNIGHGWFECGERTTVKINLGRKNFYVYGAVSSSTGYSFSLLLPEVNTVNMNIYLRELANDLGNQKAIVIMDGASWHRSADLEIPENIEVILLPPYSPELNPAEKLWQYIKGNILKNKLYTCISKLEDAVCDFIKNITPEKIISNCACRYMYN